MFYLLFILSGIILLLSSDSKNKILKKFYSSSLIILGIISLLYGIYYIFIPDNIDTSKLTNNPYDGPPLFKRIILAFFIDYWEIMSIIWGFICTIVGIDYFLKKKKHIDK